MRENRTYGSEGGESGTPDFPTPIKPCCGVDIPQAGIQNPEKINFSLSPRMQARRLRYTSWRGVLMLFFTLFLQYEPFKTAWPAFRQ